MAPSDDHPPMPDRLVGATITLRPFRADDVEMARRLSRDPYVPLTGTLPADAPERLALEWIDRQRARLEQGLGYSFAIADIDDDRALGQIGLWFGDVGNGRFTAGYAVDPAARGRGVASTALEVLVAFAWTIPAAHRVELLIEPWNGASIRTAERAAFHREGLLRGHQEIGGRRRDMLLFAAVRSDATPVG